MFDLIGEGPFPPAAQLPGSTQFILQFVSIWKFIFCPGCLEAPLCFLKNLPQAQVFENISLLQMTTEKGNIISFNRIPTTAKLDKRFFKFRCINNIICNSPQEQYRQVVVPGARVLRPAV